MGHAQRGVILMVIFAGLALLLWGEAHSGSSDSAFSGAEKKKEATVAAFERFKEVHGAKWELKFDKKTGLPKTLSGSEYEVLPGGPEEVARGFLERHGELFLLKGGLSDLRAEKTLKGAGTYHVKLQQYFKGLKVFMSGVDVSMKEDGKVHFVKSTYKPLEDMDARPAVGLEKALAAAMKEIGVEGELRGEAQGELVIYPTDEQYILSWKLLIPVAKPLGTWLVMVDAKNGEVLFKEDVLRHSGAR